MTNTAAIEPTAEATTGYLPLVENAADIPLLPAPSGEATEDYVMPARVNGWYETVNRLKEAELGGLYHLANGELWEVRHHIVTQLVTNKVEPHAEVDHGSLPTPLWRVDKGGEDYYNISTSAAYNTPAIYVNDCVFTAVEKYLEKLGLGGLSTGDRRWFKYHPNTTSDGVSRTHVLGVVHGLVAPYGLGIDHVYFPRLSGLGEEHKDFAKALGINPGGLSTNAVSNAEFLENIGQPEGEIADTVKADYRMEFVDKPPKPCMAMLNSSVMKYKSGDAAKSKKPGNVKDQKKPGGVVRQGAANVGGKWSQTSVGQGHADYIGPRDSILGTWILAFTIARNVEYKASLAKYEEMEEIGDKFDAKKDTEKKEPEKSLATFSSKVRGTSLSEISKEKTAQVAKDRKKALRAPTTTKPTPINGPVEKAELDEQVGSVVTVYGKDGSKQEYYIDDDGGRVLLPDRELPNDEGPIFFGTCVMCGARTRKLDEYEWCTACNWWASDDGTDWESWVDAADETICPFCGDKLIEGCCGSCPYVAVQWQQSCVLSCPVHDLQPYHKGSKYICPKCLDDIGMDLAGYLEMDANMHFGLVPLESSL